MVETVSDGGQKDAPKGASVKPVLASAPPDLHHGSIDGPVSARRHLANPRWEQDRRFDVFTFTVTDLILTGYTYDPASNVESSDSATVP